MGLRGLFFALLCPGVVCAQTLSGSLSGVLSRDASPYTVTADIQVLPGDTLEVESGVVLRFRKAVSFVIKGYLKVMGGSQDTVRFVAEYDTASAGAWNGLFFQGTGSGMLQYAEIRHAATAVTCSGTSPTVQNLLVHKNINGFDITDGAAPRIHDTAVLRHNNAALRCLAGSRPVVERCLIYDNGRFGFESAVVVDNAEPTLVGNLILQNAFAGIEIAQSTTPRILHNTIVGNSMGIAVTDASPVIINNQIVLNNSGVWFDNSTPQMRYNNVWGNAQGDFNGAPDSLGVFVYSNSMGFATDKHNNLSTDPLFMDPGNRDYRLRPNSPCIDAGDPGNPALITVKGAAPDIGAFENNGLALPVELLAFSYDNGYLRWRTASETNNYGFFVERRNPGEAEFESIGFVPGMGTTTVPHDYTFRVMLETPFAWFRLRQVDFDGRATFSQTITVEAEAASKSFDLKSAFPNPLSPDLQRTRITFSLPRDGWASLHVYNLRGQRVATLIDQLLPAGLHTVFWDGTDRFGRRVARGVYFYRLQAHGRTLSRTLIVR